MAPVYKVIGAGVAFIACVVVAHFGYELSHDHLMSLVAGIVGGWFAYKFFDDIIKAEYSKIDNPPARLYPLNTLEALGGIKDVLTHTKLGDRWWSQRDISMEKMTVLYEMKWEDDYTAGQNRMIERRQVVLFGKVLSEGSGCRVELHYTVESRFNRNTANDLIKHTTAAIESELSNLAAAKTA